MTDLSPTKRTIHRLEADGWLVEIADRWIPHARPPVTIDLFGVADLIAIKSCWTMLVQVTVGMNNNPARVRKVKAEPRMHIWLNTGLRRVQVWAWRELKTGGWQPNITEIELKHLDPKEETM